MKITPLFFQLHKMILISKYLGNTDKMQRKMWKFICTLKILTCVFSSVQLLSRVRLCATHTYIITLLGTAYIITYICTPHWFNHHSWVVKVVYECLLFWNFIYLFLLVLGLHCCARVSLVVASGSCSSRCCASSSLLWLLLLQSMGSRACRLL